MNRSITALTVLIIVLIGLIILSLLPRFEEFTRPEVEVEIPEPKMTKEVIVEKNVRNVAFDLGHEPNYLPFIEYSRFTSLFIDSESKITVINGSIESLAGVDVLIVISPNTTYTDEEKNLVEQAVKNGMTLILLGEKETVRNVNQLSVNFGILFNNERVFDLTNYWLFYRNPILLEFVESNFIGNLTLDLEKIVVYDACSITAVRPASVAIYTKETASSSLRAEKGRLPVVAIAKVDGGKVLAICDTDIFTNKNIELFDNLVFARNIVNFS